MIDFSDRQFPATQTVKRKAAKVLTSDTLQRRLLAQTRLQTTETEQPGKVWLKKYILPELKLSHAKSNGQANTAKMTLRRTDYLVSG